ncbi:winged helix-turn-helix domain-containing protein [Raoultella ornithinolytica]|uniref:winged helix-turn-helix domain-containing protein n=1 Tax=Raoultella ornithinolytica TaxID=54291 RepID=UPI002DBE9252|nr:winged helix-turn-helix domain-containing protein [Raoultella ornithinolytica]MEB7861188.1 winged helix-turn-helix domain-containing protein [Raoultella ornithinolytica]MEB7983157.1 winged helix-turn-helix domain-containing protein [Raoultella ornithinolytica]
MEYLINDCIRFSSEDKKLRSIANEAAIVELSNTSTRLLIRFIESNGMLLTRKELFDVWSDYGFTYSYSALSNHVSELRKAFLSLDDNSEVLTTVPKKGFKFDAKITHSTNRKSGEGESVLSCPLDEECDESDESKGKPFFDSFKIKIAPGFTMYFFTFSTLVLILTLVYICFFCKESEVRFIKSFKKCDIYQIAYATTLKEEKAIDLVRSSDIDCTNESIDIFYAESGVDSDDFGMKIISFCKANDNSCTNYVYNKRY